MKKSTLFLALLALTTFTVRAQHFDWAKGYSSTGDGGYIKGTVTDSVGNLYILGAFSGQASWGDTTLLMVNYDLGPIGTVIAKISPDGEMLWRKALHTGNYAYNIPYDIKPLGDTAFACLVNIELSTPYNNYCYYLDTMLHGWSDYPIANEDQSLLGALFTAYLVFDFSGNLLEQHFLQLSYIDTTGSDIFKYYLLNPSFDLDAEGNIYISRQAEDRIDDETSVEVGTLMGVRLWVDHRCVGTVYENTGYHPCWSPQLLKFAPHFDTLLAARYLFDRNDNYACEINSTYTKVDRDSKVYCLSTIYIEGHGRDSIETIVVDSIQGLEFSYPPAVTEKGVMVRFDYDLTPDWLVTLDDSIINPNLNAPSLSFFHDVAFDHDSNLIFLSLTSIRGFFCDTLNFYSIPMVDGTPIPMRNSSAVLVFEQTDDRPVLRSYGIVPAASQSDISGYSIGNLVCKGNRIFLQSRYYGDLRIPGNEFLGNSIYQVGHGLTVFDYAGHVVGGMPYRTISPNSKPGPIALRDSILYLGMLLYDDDATFGDITLHGDANFSAVARYVDTAFMSTYVYVEPPIDTGNVSILVAEEDNGLVAYPNPFHQRVTIQCNETITAAYITDMMGRREQVRLTAEGTGRYTLDLTATQTFKHSHINALTHSHIQAFLLTVITADGKLHTVRLLNE